jgi:hypothetical protein
MKDSDEPWPVVLYETDGDDPLAARDTIKRLEGVRDSLLDERRRLRGFEASARRWRAYALAVTALLAVSLFLRLAGWPW